MLTTLCDVPCSFPCAAPIPSIQLLTSPGIIHHASRKCPLLCSSTQLVFIGVHCTENQLLDQSRDSSSPGMRAWRTMGNFKETGQPSDRWELGSSGCFTEHFPPAQHPSNPIPKSAGAIPSSHLHAGIPSDFCTPVSKQSVLESSL